MSKQSHLMTESHWQRKIRNKWELKLEINQYSFHTFKSRAVILQFYLFSMFYSPLLQFEQTRKIFFTISNVAWSWVVSLFSFSRDFLNKCKHGKNINLPYLRSPRSWNFPLSIISLIFVNIINMRPIMMRFGTDSFSTHKYERDRDLLISLKIWWE